MLDSRRVAGAAVLLLPAGLMMFLAFNAGGFYPGPPAYVAMLLCIVLLLRATLAKHPFEGLSWSLGIASVAMSLFALLALLSESWSHAPGRALVEFDLALMYLLAIVLFGSIARSRQRLEWMTRALTAAIVIVCTCGLITRVLPDVWHTSSRIAINRLSFPVTYWNTLGLLGVMGIVLCAHLCSHAREPKPSRVAAAAATPILATTVFFTFSRGAIAAGIISLLVYGLVGRPRFLLSTLTATVVPTVIAVKVAYDADLLATPSPATSAATAQGHHVAVIVVLCALGSAALRALLFVLDSWLERFALPDRSRVRIIRSAWAGLAVAGLIAIAALSGPISHQYHRFLNPNAPGTTIDYRARLTDPGNNGRLDMWKVAWRQFKAKPIFGSGAGTFANTWAQKRPTASFVEDAHSLYLETLDELGVVGLVLLLTAIVTMLVRIASHARGRHRPLYAAIFAVVLAWTIQAAVDWDWEMPVVTVVVFSLGGAALARRRRRSAARPPTLSPYGRTLLGLGCVLLAVAPTYVWLSQNRLNSARFAFSQRNCAAASHSAESSISILGIRPEPYEILSYCDVRLGKPMLAIAAIDKAVSLDPGNWNFQYGLAVMRAAAGLDPRPAARKALALNPLEPLTRGAWQMFRSGNRQRWEREGLAIASQFTTL